MKQLLIICLILWPNLSNAKGAYLGGLKNDEGKTFIGEYGIYGNYKPDVLLHGSIMTFKLKGEQYDGINVSASRSFGNTFQAYFGLGGLLSIHEGCNEVDEGFCNTKFTFGVYPEIGLNVFLKNISIGIYGRYYRMNDNEVDEYKVYGLKIGYGI